MGYADRPWVVALAAVVCGLVFVVFPPWNNAYGVEHSFIGSPPVRTPIRISDSITMPDGTVIKSPPPVTSTPEIAWALLIRGELIILGATVAWIALRRVRNVAAKQIARAVLMGLAVPIPVPVPTIGPFIPPLAMFPTEMFTDSNHGIPMWFISGVWLAAISLGWYVVIAVTSIVARRMAMK